MGASLFSNFYSKFIQLAFDLKYTLKMLIQKFKHKLMLQLQNWLNSSIELLSIISALAKHGLSIYKQMQATNWIKKKAKSSIKIQTIANVFLRAIINSF